MNASDEGFRSGEGTVGEVQAEDVGVREEEGEVSARAAGLRATWGAGVGAGW